jgi:lysophospholipase L1-like esterase
VGGLTTVSLQSQLTSDAATRAALAHAGIVVVTIGANDLTPLIRAWLAGGCASGCVQPAVAAMGSRLSADLATVHGLVRAGARILVTDYWAVFQDGDVARATRGAAFLPWADGVTKRANAAICAAAGGVDATCVDLYAPFKGPAGDIDDTPLLSDDGDHPNAAGEAVITRALLAALR